MDGEVDQDVRGDDGPGGEGPDSGWVHIADRKQVGFLSRRRGIMALMDTTPTDDLLRELEEADPAEAPDPADRIAAALTEELEATEVKEDRD